MHVHIYAGFAGTGGEHFTFRAAEAFWQICERRLRRIIKRPEDATSSSDSSSAVASASGSAGERAKVIFRCRRAMRPARKSESARGEASDNNRCKSEDLSYVALVRGIDNALSVPTNEMQQLLKAVCEARKAIATLLLASSSDSIVFIALPADTASKSVAQPGPSILELAKLPRLPKLTSYMRGRAKYVRGHVYQKDPYKHKSNKCCVLCTSCSDI